MKIISSKSRNRERRDTLTMHKNKLSIEVAYSPYNEEICATVKDSHDNEEVIYADRSYRLTTDGIHFLCDCARKCPKTNEGYIEFDKDDDLLKLVLKDLSILKKEFKIDEPAVTYYIRNKKVKKLILREKWIDKDFLSTYFMNKEWREKNKVIKSSINLLMEGKRLVEANRFKISEKYLNESIKILPENYTSYYYLSQLYLKTNRLELAEDYLGKAREKYRKDYGYALKYQFKNSGINITLNDFSKLQSEIKRQKKAKAAAIKPCPGKQAEIKSFNVSVDAVFSENDKKIIEFAEEREISTNSDFNLNLLAQKISLLDGFSELLCLEHINIKKFKYQLDTAKRVLSRFEGCALLSDEVGLGKTIEAGIVLKEYLIRGLVTRVLILTVPSLVSQWHEEMLLKFGINFKTTEDKEFSASPPDFWLKNNLIIASLHTAKRNGNSQIIKEINYDMLIVDEAHHLKSRNTLNWKFVNNITKKFVLFLTATPVHNNLVEIYNVITILKPGLLKTRTSFMKDFVEKGNVRKPKNIVEFKKLLFNVMIRNTRSNVDIKLPKRHAKTITFESSSEEIEIYNSVTQFIRDNYKGNFSSHLGINKFILQTLQREAGSSLKALRKTLNNLTYNLFLPEEKKNYFLSINSKINSLSKNTKLEILDDLVSSLNDKCIIFTEFLETQRMLLSYFTNKKIPVSIFNGKLSSFEKDRSINNFKEKTKILISTQSGGEGKNLQFCNIIINYDLPWNPMQIEQRIGRIHRIGQEREVYIYNLSCMNTIEYYILKILDEKINMFELIIGETELVLGEVIEDTKEFQELIMEIWATSKNKQELENKIDNFGNRLVDGKERYSDIKELDEQLFSNDYTIV